MAFARIGRKRPRSVLAGRRLRMLLALMAFRVETEHEVPRGVRVAGCLSLVGLCRRFHGLHGGRGLVGWRAFRLMFIRALFGFCGRMSHVRTST
jgi:hypothetical protein